jgi:hypothetical protein
MVKHKVRETKEQREARLERKWTEKEERGELYPAEEGLARFNLLLRRLRDSANTGNKPTK